MEAEKKESLEPAVQPPAIGAAVTLDIDALYRAHAPFIGRAILRLTGASSSTDDLLQETFVVAWKRRASFDPSRDPRPWLYGIAANLARRHRRSVFRWVRTAEGLRRETPAPAARPDREIEREEERRQVQAIITRLPFKQREVFVLYELEELDGPAIAALLSIPIGTVWTRLHHGRARFRELYERRFPKEVAR